MPFSYAPLENLYTAARDLIAATDAGETADLVDLKLALGKLEMVVLDRAKHAHLVDLARQEASEQLQVDSAPLVAVGEDGVWVEAWVYVPNEG